MRTCKEKSGSTSVYLHVPFCQSKCRYCDFYSRADSPDAMARTVDAILVELEQRALTLADTLDSVYLGGGTPSALPAPLLRKLLEPLRQRLATDGEFSVEANPASLTHDVAALFAECGVTRVTVGAQSFHAHELHTLGRRHEPADIARAIDSVRDAGIAKVGLDLMYALPEQTLAGWQESIERALACGVDHVSAYALSYEDGTPMGQSLERGQLAEMDEELQRVMYHTVCETLIAAGFEWYEVSNFARPGHRSRQNMVYWTGQPYLGLGPAACSYIGGERRTNAPDIDAYCDAIESGSPPPAESERIEGPMQLAEALMLGLRLREGVSMSELQARTGLHVQQTFPRTLAHHLATGQLLADGDRLTIPADHVFTMNNTLADFIAEA